jgi:hypothetical protein
MAWYLHAPHPEWFMSLENAVSRLFPVFSNLQFLFLASRALDYGEIEFACLALVIAVFSSPLYHLCIGFPQACLYDIWKLHVLDFWTAELTIPWGGMLFVKFRSRYVKTFLLILTVFVVGFLVTGTNSSFTTQVVVSGVTFLFVALYIAWYKIAHGYWPDYDIFQLTLGVAFTALAVVCFVVQMRWPPIYNYIHSIWHMSAAMGMFFLIGMRNWIREGSVRAGPDNEDVAEKDPGARQYLRQDDTYTYLKQNAYRALLLPNKLLERVFPSIVPESRKNQRVGWLPVSHVTAPSRK